MTHWAEQYLNLPWESGAQGPDRFNCWGLVRHVQREHFGRELPLIQVDGDDNAAIRRAFMHHPEHARFEMVAVPAHGDIVEMGNTDDVWHVGVWLDIDRGGVLHCLQGAGVIFSQRHHLRLGGWSRTLFWRMRET